MGCYFQKSSLRILIIFAAVTFVACNSELPASKPGTVESAAENLAGHSERSATGSSTTVTSSTTTTTQPEASRPIPDSCSGIAYDPPMPPLFWEQDHDPRHCLELNGKYLRTSFNDALWESGNDSRTEFYFETIMSSRNGPSFLWTNPFSYAALGTKFLAEGVGQVTGPHEPRSWPDVVFCSPEATDYVTVSRENGSWSIVYRLRVSRTEVPQRFTFETCNLGGWGRRGYIEGPVTR